LQITIKGNITGNIEVKKILPPDIEEEITSSGFNKKYNIKRLSAIDKSVLNLGFKSFSKRKNSKLLKIIRKKILYMLENLL
jgi:predicted component of type VI protein secretion system